MLDVTSLTWSYSRPVTASPRGLIDLMHATIQKMYNKHATSKGQTERRPMNSYEFQWTGPHGIIHIDSRHARTYTTGTHKHAGSMGRTRQIGWARLGGFNANRQVSFNNPYMFLAGKRISNKQTPAPSVAYTDYGLQHHVAPNKRCPTLYIDYII